MLAGVITSRSLGPEGKGVAILAFFLPQFLTSLGTLSMGEASTYYLGRGVAPRRIVSNTFLQTLGLGVVYMVGALLLLGPLKASVVKDVPATYVILGLLTLPIQLLRGFGDNVLVGMGRVTDFVAGNLLLHLSRGFFFLVALVFLKLGVRGAVAAEFLTWLLVGGYYARAMLRGTGMDFRMDWPLARDQLRYGFQAHLGNIAQRMNLQMSTLILSSLSGAAAVGLFSVAVNLAQVLWYIPDSVGRLLFPRVASSTREEANRVTALVCRNTILLTLVACLALFLLGRWVIVFLNSEAFVNSVLPLYLLLPGILALSVSKVLTKYLSGIGKPYLNALASILAFIANVPAMFLLVKSHGLPGAAVATSIVYGIHAVLVTAFYVRESGTPPAASLLPARADLRLYVDGFHEVWRHGWRHGHSLLSFLWRRLGWGKMAS